MHHPTEPITQAAFLKELEPAWTRVEATLHDVQQRGHSDLRDDAGWTPLNHLAHLAIWAHSTLIMVRSGRPQWEGLGVPREQLDMALQTGDYDALNESIRRQTANWSLEHTEDVLRTTHQDIVQCVEGLNDKALAQPAFAYADGGGDISMIEKLRSNTSGHYPEHCDMIDRILESDAS